jgi:hypothetical protein
MPVDLVLSSRPGGRLFPFGLFPTEQATPIPRRGGWMFSSGFDYARVVERLRRDTGDPSRAIPTVDARLHVEIEPPCRHAATLSLHDDLGDRVFDTGIYDTAEVDAVVRLPVGATWRLTLHDGGGIDFDQGRQGWGVRIGSIQPANGPVTINVGFECTLPVGTVDVVTAAAAPTTPAASPVDAPVTPEAPTPTIADASLTREDWAGELSLPGVLVAAAAVVAVLVGLWRRSRVR